VTTRRLAQTLLVVAALVSTTITARAATVETKVRAVMRDRPAPSARIVDRVPSGKKLKLLGQSGNWIHVKTGNKDGWISASELKGLRGGASDEAAAPDANDTGDDDGPVRPLAKARGVRPEAWVSKSRYHEGEETKLIVSVNKAELFGRPSSTGAVLGILRRGKALRYASLAVMLLSVGKVFLYDTANLSDLYRVFSFLGLGVSLLALAWVYQRFVFREMP